MHHVSQKKGLLETEAINYVLWCLHGSHEHALLVLTGFMGLVSLVPHS